MAEKQKKILFFACLQLQEEHQEGHTRGAEEENSCPFLLAKEEPPCEWRDLVI